MVTTRTRLRTIARAAVVLAVVALAGCQWTSARFDVGGTGNNVLERALSPTNIGSLRPAWSGTGGTVTGLTVTSTPIVAGSLAYVSTTSYSITGGTLSAFDADGSTGCSGSPKVCTPAWQALSTTTGYSQPAVFDGILFTEELGLLRAFDAAGIEGCSGTPRICHPLWSGTTPASNPIVVDGTLFVGDPSNGVVAYDAFDTSVCTGSPKVCQPRRSYQLPPRCPPPLGGCSVSNHVIRGTRLFVGVTEFTDISTTGEVAIYDRTGATGCSGAPVVCVPSQHVVANDAVGLLSLDSGFFAVGTHSVWTEDDGTISDTRLFAYDPAGTARWSAPVPGRSTGLATTPDTIWLGVGADVVAYAAAGACGSTCMAVRHAPTSSPVTTPPALANGLVLIGTQSSLQAFDATGASGCSGAPAVCAPLRTIALGSPAAGVAVAQGLVFVTTTDGRLHVFGLPTP